MFVPPITIKIDSPFGQAMAKIIADRKPERIIETGTHLGTGSTKTICDAIDQTGVKTDFHTIECNPNFYAQAVQNLRGRPVTPHLGLSIARADLPSLEQIQQEMKATEAVGMIVDPGANRNVEYLQESGFYVEDNLMGKLLDPKTNPPCGLILLDSAGHLGWHEFLALAKLAKNPMVVALDDCKHIKHWRSVDAIKKGAAPGGKWTMLVEGEDRWGWVLAEFTPDA